MSRTALPAPAPRSDRPPIATTRNVQAALLARQVAVVPAILAARRAVCGVDERAVHPHLDQPLARLEAAGARLQRSYAETLAFLGLADAPPPQGQSLAWAVEEWFCADHALAGAIEERACIEGSRHFSIAARMLRDGEAARHVEPGGAVTIYPTK